MAQRSKRSPPSESQNQDDKEIKPVESNELQFITFTDFSQTTNRETKKKVRSHAMHRVQQNIRSGKGREREGEIVLDISPLSEALAGPSRDPNNSMLGTLILPHPSDLGAGRSDPFAPYPINMDVRTHELYDHLNGKTCPMFKTLSKIGFFQTVRDEAAFRQILCTSSSHMTFLRGSGEENPEAIVLSTEAIRSINRRIADPRESLSDGVLITILAFACHAVMFNDYTGSLTHFNGLEVVIRQRGGVQSFVSNPVLRTVFFWLDVTTAFLHDRPPRFPSPDNILPTIIAQPLFSLPDPTLLNACLTDEMRSAVNDLLILNQSILSELATRDLWDDGVFAGLYILPVLAKFLSIRPDINGYSPALARQESCRIGALLYLAGIRHRFGVQFSAHIYIPKLKQAIISQAGSNAEEISPLIVWLLVLGGTQSFMNEDHKWFVQATAALVQRLQLSTWDGLMDTVRMVSWIEGILEVDCDLFRMEVSSESWNSHEHLFS